MSQFIWYNLLNIIILIHQITIGCGVLNLLFWNLGKNNNDTYVADIVDEYQIDVAIFAEYQETDFSTVSQKLNSMYKRYNGFGGCDKVTLLSRNDVIVRREQNRYTLYSFAFEGKTYVIAGVHLPANPHADSDQRKNVIRDLIQDIGELERELKTSNTIVIGDLNASPFDTELIQKDAFNAVLYKELIKQAEYITINGKRYRRFYNPAINFISEDAMNYGSLYYSAGMNSLYWLCFDQVLVRKSLADSVFEMKYCRSIKGKSLLKRLMPNKEISDHLPLLVKLERGILT